MSRLAAVTGCVLDADGNKSGRLTVHTNAANPGIPSIYNQNITDNGYGYLTTRDGTKLAIDVPRRPTRGRTRATGRYPRCRTVRPPAVSRRSSNTRATAMPTRLVRRTGSRYSRTSWALP